MTGGMGRTVGRSDVPTELFPISQDFVPYRNRCPATLGSDWFQLSQKCLICFADADAADAAEEPADLRRRQRLKSLSRLRQLDRGCKYRKYKCDPRSKTNYGCLIWDWGWGTKYCWHSTTTDWCWTGKIRTDKENTPNGTVKRRWVPKSAQCTYDSDCLRYAGNGCTGDRG